VLLIDRLIKRERERKEEEEEEEEKKEKKIIFVDDQVSNMVGS
jgi:hypothetical protein